MEIAPLEAAHAQALHELLRAPEAARRIGRTPWDAPALTQALLKEPTGGVVHRLGLWEGGRLVAAAGLSKTPSARAAHEGRLWLTHAEPALPRPLVQAMLDLAERWLGLWRLQLELEPDDAALAGLQAFGFEEEVRMTRRRLGPGGTGDALILGRLRPGVAWSEPGPAPAWPERGAPADAEVRIRPATAEDADDFARVLMDASVIWGTMQLPSSGLDLWRSRLTANDPTQHRAFVAVADGEVVGNAGLHFESGVAHRAVVGMGVRSTWQGRGVGRLLLRRLLELADWLGVARLELEVYPDNTRGVALYERHGFVHEGRRRRAVLRDGAHVDVLAMARLAG